MLFSCSKCLPSVKKILRSSENQKQYSNQNFPTQTSGCWHVQEGKSKKKKMITFSGVYVENFGELLSFVTQKSGKKCPTRILVLCNWVCSLSWPSHFGSRKHINVWGSFSELMKPELSSPAEECYFSFILFVWFRNAFGDVVLAGYSQASCLWRFLPGNLPGKCEAHNKQCRCILWMKTKYFMVILFLKCAEVICWIETQKQFGMLFSWLVRSWLK